MPYDLQRVSAPIIQGRVLATLTAVTENRVSGKVVIKKLMQDMGFDKFRTTEVTDSPTMYPLVESSEKAVEQPTLESLAQINPNPDPENLAEPVRSAELYEAYKKGDLSPLTVAKRVLEVIAATENSAKPLRAVVAYHREQIIAQAKKSEERWKKNSPLGPLDGIPVLVKDELDVKGYPTTVGTAFLGEAPKKEDATVVKRLREAGAVIIGKANMHEIGIGITGFNAHHGVARNPYDLARHTGGSSSGSAAAVAAGICPIAVAADGGGSIRIPAAHCGMYGLKATFGRISEHGAFPLCWSVAHVGPIASSAADLALGYAIMAGPDPHDRISLKQPPLRFDGINSDEKLFGLKIGVYDSWFKDADNEIVRNCQNMLDDLEGRGAEICAIVIPELDMARLAHAVTIVSEMSAAMTPYYVDHRKDFGLDTRLNLALARSIGGEDYVRAQRVRTQAMNAIKNVFDSVDFIATPTTGRTAPLIPEQFLATGSSDLGLLTDIMRFVTLGNLVGIPAITVPVGYDREDLPIGMQFMANHWQEHLLLRLAAQTEQILQRKAPKLHFNLRD